MCKGRDLKMVLFTQNHNEGKKNMFVKLCIFHLFGTLANNNSEIDNFSLMQMSVAH